MGIPTLSNCIREDCMDRKSLVEKIRDFAEKEAEGTEITVVEAEFVKENNLNYLRIYIDKDNGVSTDDCLYITRIVNGFLDQNDPFDEPYFLEVSSLGIDRPFKTESDFQKHIGKEVEVKLYSKINGRKFIKGLLINFDRDTVVIEESNEKIEIERNKIIKINKSVEF